jgi:hypothetical protein
MDLEAARKHIELAKKQWERASSDAWEPADPASCITNLFYAYENLIVALAEAHGREWKPSHYKKAELASQLASACFQQRPVYREVLILILSLRQLTWSDYGCAPGCRLLP